MVWTCVALADVPASPWRNGGGLTRELLVEPTTDWLWRVSVAEVASDGPFSLFAGVERRLAILAGAGVRLHFAERSVDLRAGDPPLSFSGSAAVHCLRLDGPVRDLNLMLRAPASGAMFRVDGRYARTLEGPRVVAIYAHAEAELRIGETLQRIPPHTLAWQALPGGVCLQVASVSAYWMEIQPQAAAG